MATYNIGVMVPYHNVLTVTDAPEGLTTLEEIRALFNSGKLDGDSIEVEDSGCSCSMRDIFCGIEEYYGEGKLKELELEEDED